MPGKTYYMSPEGTLQREPSEEEILAILKSKQGLIWLDICETTEEDGLFLERVFGFHHLSVEDCVSTKTHPPKIDDFGDYLFLIVHGVNHLAESDIVDTAELAMFFGTNFVVSNHNLPLYSTESVRKQVEDDGQPLKRGADFLAHALIYPSGQRTAHDRQDERYCR